MNNLKIGDKVKFSPDLGYTNNRGIYTGRAQAGEYKRGLKIITDDGYNIILNPREDIIKLEG